MIFPGFWPSLSATWLWSSSPSWRPLTPRPPSSSCSAPSCTSTCWWVQNTIFDTKNVGFFNLKFECFQVFSIMAYYYKYVDFGKRERERKEEVGKKSFPIKKIPWILFPHFFPQELKMQQRRGAENDGYAGSTDFWKQHKREFPQKSPQKLWIFKKRQYFHVTTQPSGIVC